MENIPNNIFEITLQGYAKGFNVSQIATFGLETCSPEEDTKEVFNRLPSFDQIPVKQFDRIIGVLERNGKAQNGLVEQHYRPLDDSILASADEALSTFLLSMEKPPYYRLVVKGTKIDGIVTRSDILKLPVRLYLFALVTNLELLMIEIINKNFNNDDWINYFDKSKQSQIIDRKRFYQKERIDPSLIELTYFKEKYEVIGIFFDLGKEFISDFEKINNQIRNPISHARDFIKNETELIKFLQVIQLMQEKKILLMEMLDYHKAKTL